MSHATTTITRRLSTFGFLPGILLAGKYEVRSLLGCGWEAEVYRLRERFTGIDRAGKFVFPHRNVGNRAAKFQARKLHKLRHCPILVQYHTQEQIDHEGMVVTCLVSELVEGEQLSQFLARQPGRRLNLFAALHLLHALAAGVACIHEAGEYHGDLHAGNILLRQYGLTFAVKLIDMYHWGPATAAMIRTDVCDLIRIFYDALGGARTYAKQPPLVKEICLGLKRGLIGRKFRTAGHLCRHLETLQWTT